MYAAGPASAAMPIAEDGSPRPGLKAVLDGLRYLALPHANVRMTFVADLCAMVLAQPRALFPAMAVKVYGGGAATVGVLQAAPAFGSLLGVPGSPAGSAGCACSGLAVVIVGHAATGSRSASVGLTSLLWVGAVCLALSRRLRHGERGVPLDDRCRSLPPDQMRGRLQGVFIVVVAGGPRAGDFLAGTTGELLGERVALVLGGLACVGGRRSLPFLRWPGFLAVRRAIPDALGRIVVTFGTARRPIVRAKRDGLCRSAQATAAANCAL